MLDYNRDMLERAALAVWVFALTLARCPWVRPRARPLLLLLCSRTCMWQDGYDRYEYTNYCVDNEDLMCGDPSPRDGTVRFPGSFVIESAARQEESSLAGCRASALWRWRPLRVVRSRTREALDLASGQQTRWRRGRPPAPQFCLPAAPQ